MQTQLLLNPPIQAHNPGHQMAPIKDLERLWLECTCAYDQLDDNIMEDTLWDKLTQELRERQEEWSPYFREAVPSDCIESSTSSGIDWEYGLPLIVKQGLEKDTPERVRRWYVRLEDLYEEMKCPEHSFWKGHCDKCGANEIYWTGRRRT